MSRLVGEWMSLGEVAKILGVHPSTVRGWSDQGALPVHRTKGGHRRFLRSEVDLWLQAQRTDGFDSPDLVMQNALRNTRFQVSEGRLAAEDWYNKMDEQARQEYRLSGRALLQGLVKFMNTADSQAVIEAEALGYEYAARGRRNGLSSSEATRAFLFFRNLVIESMLAIYEAAAVRSAHAWSDMFRKVNEFTDAILIAILETYEVHQRMSQ
jgi:excisionase family DNA binding protein